jgi:endonuclease YncB( thermonuclease family)
MRTSVIKVAIVSSLFTAVSLAFTGPAWADDWLVYLGGGLEEIDGGWDQRRGQVVFRRAGGTLTSIPFSEVDLAASAFITWQLNGRSEAPPRSPLPERAGEVPNSDKKPCQKAVVVALAGSETLEVMASGNRETVHVACLDAPETGYDLAPLGFFGRATLSTLRAKVKSGDEVCLTEHSPPRVDAEGHRIVYVSLNGDFDYTAGVILAGLGLLRLGECSRAAEYRRLEDRAIGEGRGLWGRSGARAAFSVAQSSMVFTPDGDASGGASGGARGGAVAPPRRRAGGG